MALKLRSFAYLEDGSHKRKRDQVSKLQNPDECQVELYLSQVGSSLKLLYVNSLWLSREEEVIKNEKSLNNTCLFYKTVNVPLVWHRALCFVDL